MSAATPAVKAVLPLPPSAPVADALRRQDQLDRIERMLCTVVERLDGSTTAPAPQTDLETPVGSAEAMRILGYKDHGAFLDACKRLSVPRYKQGPRRYVYYPSELVAWMDRKKERSAATLLRERRAAA